MYQQTETTTEITMYGSGSLISPLATLKDEWDGVCQIIIDDNCYVICLKQCDGTYKPTTHIFREAFEVLKTLPVPV
jgi:hypothetical protein